MSWTSVESTEFSDELSSESYPADVPLGVVELTRFSLLPDAMCRLSSSSKQSKVQRVKIR